MPEHKPLTPSLKLVYIVIGVLLVALGILGLVIPVIPGIIFLAGALYIFSRVSRRFHNWSHGHPRLRRVHYRMEQMRLVGFGARLRMVGLMCVGGFVAGVGAVAGMAARLTRRRKRITYQGNP